VTGNRPCDVTNRPTDFVAQNVGNMNMVARLPKTRWLPNGKSVTEVVTIIEAIVVNSSK